ncbi:hypothetical protein LB517_01410 [Mesorhizobium sp. BR1-1-12]|uniref:hypothetical protein n=1 Tax=unclassified Mesorhizobium TaxID=325217 RepID=UPI001CCCC8C0|nr:MULTISPECIES: hypothetical protein [unclassified Mesorhizobium]MBZ9917108.1 hypothetical protein [Mesorhizobium sp. BR1-1-7]MBZ9968272.1 hypothetical protein [Mesorhizobium sp. BR1-1-12]
MTSSLVTTGITGNTYKALLRKQMMLVKPPVVGLAVAYVSTSGFSLVKKILDDAEVEDVRLVTDTKDGVTHPKALRCALNCGWGVRVVDTLAGTFHPKLYVGADSFHNEKGATGLSLAIAGSPNISHGAFMKNGECAFWSVAPHGRASAAKAWHECWEVGEPLTAAKLTAYEKYFSLRNRARRPEDLVALGVADSVPATLVGALPTPPKSDQQALPDSAATVAWAGLQSFTGEYRLQVEFPKEAGLVLNRVFGTLGGNGSIDLHCSDGQTRPFSFKYYNHNGMFRLNIPNSTPDVDWARANKAGIAYVEHDLEDDEIYFEIIRPSKRADDIARRSIALGTWGKTSTRLYGWY